MKRRITLALCLTFYAAILQAQITLNQASFSTWALGTDSARVISSITAVPSNNATWDLTGGNYGALDIFSRTPVSGNATYPSCTYSVPGSYSFNPVLAYESTEMNGLNATGIHNYGQVLQRQPVSLASLTGGANDSLVFEQQDIVYPSPKTVLAFPATLGTAWSSGYTYDLNFSLTVAAYGLNATPGAKRSMITHTDSVVGWGKMRVKTAAGQNSTYMDVLAVKVALLQTDSFFLNGAPAPAPLVTAFGLTQGQTNGIYYIAWFRAGEGQPLLTIFYTDDTYSTPMNSFVHAARLSTPPATGISALQGGNKMTLFPNPVIDGMLNISIGNAGGRNYSYELINCTGKKVASAAISLSNGYARIPVDQPPGLYYVNLIEDGHSAGCHKVIIGH